MKKLLFVFMLFAFSLSAFGQGENVLSILMKDGTSVYFLLKEKPCITFGDDDLKVVSDTDEAVMKRSLVDHFEFVAEVPSGIEEVEENAARESFELSGDAVHVSGLTPGCKVQLYSVNGQSVLSAAANEAGAATIHIGSLSSGIYLVNYNEITIKFIKQ